MYTRRVHLCVHLPKRHLVTVRRVFFCLTLALRRLKLELPTSDTWKFTTSNQLLLHFPGYHSNQSGPLNDWLPQKERRWRPRWLSKKLKDFHLKALWAATPKWDARCSNSSVRGPGRSYLIGNDRKMWTRGIKRSISTQLNKTYRKVCVVFFDMTANLLILRKPSVHLLKMFPSPNLFQTCQTPVLHPGSSSLTRQLHFFPHQITRG